VNKQIKKKRMIPQNWWSKQKLRVIEN
jgi:hypothetical protein